MDVQINYDYRGDDLKDMPLVELAQFVLDHQEKPENTEVSLSFVTDDEIARLNEQYRAMQGPTDVLSFPMFDLTPGEKPQEDWADPDSGCVPLGDMVLSLERVAAQAQEYGHSRERELSYLVVHSVLHLLGYDHLDEGPQKKQMRAREEAILAELGIGRGE